MTCPLDPAHGRVYDTDRGRFYCPHSDHDRDRSQSFFSEDEVFAGHLKAGVQTPPRKRGKRK